MSLINVHVCSLIRLHPFITSVLGGGEGQEILATNTKKKNSSYKKSDKGGGGVKKDEKNTDVINGCSLINGN